MRRVAAGLPAKVVDGRGGTAGERPLALSGMEGEAHRSDAPVAVTGHRDGPLLVLAAPGAGGSRALAERLANGPTRALGEMKRTIRRGLQSDFASTLQMEANGQRIAADSADAHEGIAAFLQKRKAEFRGA